MSSLSSDKTRKRTPKSKKAKQTELSESHSQQEVAGDGGERIQKMLAHAGLGSRRQIEQWIRDGKIRINSQIARLGDRIQPSDELSINGRRVDLEKRINAPIRVLIYHKPTGEMVTRRDPEGRPVIFTQLPKLRVGRWIAVGRLDLNTQGLLLVTTHGELANRLMHPSQQISREYSVRVFGKVTEDMLVRLREGVELDDGPAKFDFITPSGGEGANRWFNVQLSEGRNRIVRRLFESQGVTVSRLMRVRYGPVILPERLKARTFYELNEDELKQLFEFVGLTYEQPADQEANASTGKRPPRHRNSRKRVRQTP